MIDIFSIDVNSLPDQGVGNFFVCNQDTWFYVVARTKDGPMQSCTALGIDRFYVGAAVHQFLRLRQVVKNRFFFSLAGRLVELPNQWRIIGNVELQRSGRRFVFGRPFLRIGVRLSLCSLLIWTIRERITGGRRFTVAKPCRPGGGHSGGDDTKG